MLKRFQKSPSPSTFSSKFVIRVIAKDPAAYSAHRYTTLWNTWDLSTNSGHWAFLGHPILDYCRGAFVRLYHQNSTRVRRDQT